MAENKNPFGHYPKTALFEITGALVLENKDVALLVTIDKTQPLDNLENELREYLVQCRPIALKEGYNGFAITQESTQEEINPTIH